jgi:hypothetical protein
VSVCRRLISAMRPLVHCSPSAAPVSDVAAVRSQQPRWRKRRRRSRYKSGAGCLVRSTGTGYQLILLRGTGTNWCGMQVILRTDVRQEPQLLGILVWTISFDGLRN